MDLEDKYWQAQRLIDELHELLGLIDELYELLEHAVRAPDDASP